MAGLQEFREHLGGRLTVMLLRELGVGEEVHEIAPGLVLAAVDLLRRGEAVSPQYAAGLAAKPVARGLAWARRRIETAAGNLALVPAKEG